ncbi:Uncharacterised protein [Mycobacteroides abscessus subsp. massiliense]|nr:Uncharacterised protein [Mycobacteroides abscessus subsp. massiliense]SKK28739.1 Uncharacterised protein [Mycobacteroides abscessus subsp. massiliense]SKK51436.1 Uncharacterised protein [Mycobacteroides abscessus subsp. massiliense]
MENNGEWITEGDAMNLQQKAQEFLAALRRQEQLYGDPAARVTETEAGQAK